MYLVMREITIQIWWEKEVKIIDFLWARRLIDTYLKI